MFTRKNINIFDFDIYARRISFFFNSKEKIGSFFGFILTILYITSVIILFFYYSIKAIKRSQVKTHDSTMYPQGTPSIQINPNILYFAFGLEDPNSLNRYIDETIYYPIIHFIYKEKENGIFVTKERINLKAERCNVEKFGDNYKNLFVSDELNNSYCLEDYNLTLIGGFKYDSISYLMINIYPCVNNTENNFHCKPKNIIDSYLSSTYFSMIIKDIGLNPINYTVPIIPTIQNIYDTVNYAINREFLLYFGITEIHTDIGLFSTNIKKDIYLQFRKYFSTFIFREEADNIDGKEIFVAHIRLEEYIHVQNRVYTKISEIFSTIGGFMQLISNIFMLLTLLTKNINIEKKLLNNLFNFNIKQKKIILSIKYAKKLNYLMLSEKGALKSFLPFSAIKCLTPYTNINTQINSFKKSENIYLKKNNSYGPLMKKRALLIESQKVNDNKIKLRNNNQREIEKIIISKRHRNSIQDQINKSKQIMLIKEDELNESQMNRIYFKRNKKNGQNIMKECSEIKSDENDSLRDVKINIFDYFCRFGKMANKKTDIELFISGVNFYRNQMSIINYFNIMFLIEIMLTQQSSRKMNFFNKIFEIPLKTGKISN